MVFAISAFHYDLCLKVFYFKTLHVCRYVHCEDTPIFLYKRYTGTLYYLSKHASNNPLVCKYTLVSQMEMMLGS